MASTADRIFDLLKLVPDAYPDFVLYTPDIAESKGVADKLLDYLLKNPGLTSSDVLEWIDENAAN